MAIQSNPYLSFPTNNAREAMTFYGEVFGAEPTFLPLSGMPGMPEGTDLLMHSELKTDEIHLMAADNCGNQELTQGNCFDIALMVPAADAARGRELFAKLSAGGQVFMPLEAQPWGDVYGQFVDKFGVRWAFNIGQSEPVE